MRELDEIAIENIALGASLLGTGGGGDPYIGKLMALSAVRKYGPVKLISLDEVPDDALIVPTAMMGAPVVIVDNFPNPPPTRHPSMDEPIKDRFDFVDATDDIKKLEDKIPKNITRLNTMLVGREPELSVGKYCDGLFNCEFTRYCSF